MAYDEATIIAHVRALIPNLSARDYSDDNMRVIIGIALRRLNKDSAATSLDRVLVLAGDGGRYYDLSGDAPTGVGALWGPNVSIKRIYRPTKDQVARNRDIFPIPLKDYAIVPTDADTTSLYFVDPLSANDTATIVLNAPNVIETIPDVLQSAIEFLVAALACYAMSSKAAGVTDSDLPADIISYRSKQMEFRRAGQAWEEQYSKEVGLNQPVIAAAMKADYDLTLQSGPRYMTHDSYRR